MIAAVHTTGINWEAAGVVVAPVLAGIGAVVKLQGARFKGLEDGIRSLREEMSAGFAKISDEISEVRDRLGHAEGVIEGPWSKGERRRAERRREP